MLGFFLVLVWYIGIVFFVKIDIGVVIKIKFWYVFVDYVDIYLIG